MTDTQIITRQFLYTDANKDVIVLEDPNIDLPVETIKSMYANQYPELLNASVIDKGINDLKLTYEFETIAGTKG